MIQAGRFDHGRLKSRRPAFRLDGFRGRPTGGGGGGAFTPADAASTVAFYDFTAGNVFTDTAGTTPAGIGDPVGSVTDLVGGYHGVQPSPSSQPVLQSNAAGEHIYLDGIDDFMDLPVGPILGPATSVFFAMDHINNGTLVFAANGSTQHYISYINYFNNSAPSSNNLTGSADHYVDGVALDPETRGQLFNELTGQGPHVLEVRTVDFTAAAWSAAWSDGTGGRIFTNTAASNLHGEVRLSAMCFMEAPTVEEENLVRQWMADRCGATLP